MQTQYNAKCATGLCETVQAVQNAKTRCGRSVAHLKAQINTAAVKSLLTVMALLQQKS